MKTLLKIIFGLIAIFFIASLFLDSSVKIEHSIEIKSPVNKVFMKVANTKEWQNWEYWSELDSTIKNTYQGPTFGENSVRSWTSDESGNGTMTFTEVELNKRIDYNLDFVEPIESHAKGYLTFEQIAGITKITWAHIEEFPFHMRFFGLLVESMIGTAFEGSLINLKTLCEQEKD